MSKYQIAWMPGDGVGGEVMESARLVLDVLNLDAEYIEADIGWKFWCEEGDPLPQRTIDILNKCDCGLFGAITSKPNDEASKELTASLQGKGLIYRSPIVRLRQLFDLYVNLRPCKAYPGNPHNYRDDINLVVFRENTEGLYSGVEYYPLSDDLRAELEKANKNMMRFHDIPSDEIALSLRVVTQNGAERIIRKAYEYAKEHGYSHITLVEKPNVLRETSGLMTRVARKLAKEYEGIELWETNIDAQTMFLLKKPDQYGVMVTSNLFGDVLSDMAAQLVGGPGFAASGNIGDNFALFEPVHGSAPDIAGQQVVNPIAMLLAVKMMLDWLGETEKAESLDKAIMKVILDGKIRTKDMGGNSSTMEVGKAIAQNLK